MANKYLHQVTALGAAPASGDLFHITDVSDTTDLAQGTSKSITYANLLSGISITESQISDLGSYITLTDLSVGAEASASGDGALSYNSSTGVFTYTPPTLAGLNGSIDDLSDVTLTSTATNDILSWNGSAFVNTDAPTLDALQFDLTAAETAAVGQLAWNSEDLTLDLGLDTNVTLQVGQEQVARIKATTTIRNGMAVYISGVTGGSDQLEGTPFSADSASGVDELRFLGIATEAFSTNDIGFVTTFGKVRGVDGTTYASGGIRDNADTESWSVGDILYASPNIAGTLTSVVPTAPDREMPIAIVVKVSAETNITIFVRAEHGYHLNELHDVLISGTPADNEVLAYDSASGNWINQTAAEAGIITASSTDNLTNKTFSDHITVAEIAAPSTPSTGFGAIYAKTDGKLYFKNDAGTETDLTAAGGGGSGTVTSVDMSVPTGFAISGNPITTSGTLALAFDTGYSLPTTSSQTNWNTAYGWGDHSTAGYLTDITGENLSSLSDVTITSIASGELIKWNGSAWINNTLAEAGIAATGHTHSTSDITSGTFADARIAQSNVTQHQAALSITESQISDFGTYLTGITGESIGSLSDVTITSIASGEILKWSGSAWINNTLAEAGIAAASHTHATSDITSGTFADARIAQSNVTQHQAALSVTESQISDFGTYLTGITGESIGSLSDVTITTVASGEVLKWSGSAWINNTLAEAGIAATGHTHATSDITSGTFADARIAQSNVTQHQSALSITESQISDLGSYISNVVEDTTPQLGGQLDVNGQAIGDGTRELLTFTEDASAVNHVNIENEATGSGPIISAAGDDTNIDLNLAGKGTGNISLGNMTFDADQSIGAGQDNYVLTYDHSAGTISLEAASGGGSISNVVEDTTPQLGGQLDVNGNSIGDGTRALLGFVEDASAVNYIEIENEATGSGPIIRSTGTDTNVDLNLQTKGSGDINLESLIYSETNKKLFYSDITGAGTGTALTITSAGVDSGNTNGANGGALSLGSGDADDSTGGNTGNVTLASGVSTSGGSGSVAINTGGSDTGSGSITLQTGSVSSSGSAGDIILAPASDAVGGTYGDVRPDGDGVQNLGTASNRWKAFYQTTNYFVETGAGTNYVAFTAPSSIASDVTWTLPNADGSSGQVLSTNGSGTLSWATASGGGISNVVEDTTPQLGGQLDVNGNAIGDGTRELLTFTEDASAVNHINIENQATGGGPIISAAGDDTNIDLNLRGKATGNVIVSDGTDVTKTLSFELSGATTSTKTTLTASQTAARTITLPDATDTLVGKATTDTLTNKTFDANGTGNSLSNVETADLASAAKTGADTKVVTGTEGTNGNLIQWNADGDAVDASLAVADVVTGSSTDTFTNKTFDANGTGNSLSNVETADIASGSKTGSDTTLVTGTAGTNGNLVSWNADGDAVDSSVVAANVITTSNTASTSASGIVELATAAETTTGTDTGRAVTPDGLAGSDFGKTVVSILVSDPNGDAITTGDGKAYWRVPATLNGFNLVDVEMAVTTASTSGTPTVQIHNVTDTADMLSTSLTIDANETDSSTAATAAVINTATDDVATADMLRIDIDTAGTGTKGLIVELTFQLP